MKAKIVEILKDFRALSFMAQVNQLEIYAETIDRLYSAKDGNEPPPKEGIGEEVSDDYVEGTYIVCELEEVLIGAPILVAKQGTRTSKRYATFPNDYGGERVYLKKLTRPTVSEEWISVEDRLPERESPDEALPVLVSIGEVGPVYEAIYEGKGEFCRSIYEDYPADITHWMPLPAPPKEEGDEG